MLAQVRVAPGERIELDLALPEGAYRLRGPQLAWSIDFRVQSSAPIRRWDLNLAGAPSPDFPRELRSGGQVLVLANEGGRELLGARGADRAADDALTAARASSLALFRELFPGEVLDARPTRQHRDRDAPRHRVGSGPGRRALSGLGERVAFGVIHEYFRLLEDAIRHGRGALVKTTGEGVLAAFGVPEDAVRLASTCRACWSGE